MTTRRTLLKGGVAAGAWALIGTVTPAQAVETDLLPDFPADVELHRNVFRNWDGTTVTDQLWTSTVTTPEQVERIVNWAAQAQYRVRAVGKGHTWAPLIVNPATPADTAVVLVDTTRMTSMSMVNAEQVRLQAGADMGQVMAFLSANGRSLLGAPAPGDVTVGGILAVNGHGSSTPKSGAAKPAGGTYGTVSNAVVELTAVVWDEDAGRYAQRTFHRADPQIGPLLTHLGRAFVTEVVLSTVANYNLRCRNTTLIPTWELFARPEHAGPRSVSALLNSRGTVGLIWYAMTTFPWVQTWEVSPRKPLTSWPRNSPYNYPFADRLPGDVANAIARVTQESRALTPVATETMLQATRSGLINTAALDMWGEAKNFIHFVRPSTLLVSAGSHVVITRRDQIQRVIHQFTQHYQNVINTFRWRGQFPANNVCEIRITGVDNPADIGVAGAATATLSAAQPVPGRPELDTAIWLDVLNLPGTPHTAEFYTQLETWFTGLPAELGVARPEWSKRFAHSSAGPWTNADVLDRWIPGQFPGWQQSAQALNALDPRGIFRAPFHDRLMPQA
ncbi:cholesterol oxidase substrate-binding domain-containing protein [Kocuria sp.]|uniref:cholesterol oxidase substrate-binding domain-containing protein n=1 Tax=Kocuria sp. TaxID=1871328 RepID=UPI0026DFCC27|nr:cholesterol oxidase substrate-binding domain-containing protein [Kocuria sp.]MDO5619409.1 cholesterol oxidase substrate-binding domain-containing protein [Kocuria sp.]